jgi:hypothetical protein
MRNLKFGKGAKNSWFVGQRDLENVTQVLNFCSRHLLNPLAAYGPRRGVLKSAAHI